MNGYMLVILAFKQRREDIGVSFEAHLQEQRMLLD